MTDKVRIQDMYDKAAIDQRVDADKRLLVPEKMEAYSDARPCFKCGGEGWIPAFVHIADGICFVCYGKGFISRQYAMRHRWVWQEDPNNQPKKNKGRK